MKLLGILFYLLCASEMYVSQPDELKNAPKILLTSLEEYHQTREYNPTSSPVEYISHRIESLEKLQKVIPEPYVDLRKQVETKLNYLRRLPAHINHPVVNRNKEPKPLAVEMQNQYQFEKIDPLHRTGEAVWLWMNRWHLSNIPNFFVYLELMEYDPLLSRFAPFTKRVTYYTSEKERAPHRLTFREGLCYLQGKLLDTDNHSTISSQAGAALLTVGLDKQFYINDQILHQLHHSSEFAGEPLLFAGEIRAKEGKISLITNMSGHYRPGPEEVLEMLELLQENLGSLEGIELKITAISSYSKNPFFVPACYDAAPFLESQGEILPKSLEQGWTPLHFATFRNRSAEGDLHAVTDRGQTPLHIAAEKGYVERIEELLERGADPEACDLFGNMPLHLALGYSHEEAALVLIAAMKEIDLPNNNLVTPLHLATCKSQKKALEALLDRGADPCKKDKHGTPLVHFATGEKKLTLLKRMRGHFDETNDLGETLLHAAARRGGEEVIEYLLSEGLDPNKLDNQNNSPLHTAIRARNKATLKKLLPLCTHSCNSAGEKPLHLAAEHFQSQILHLFIPFTEDLNEVDGAGNTPLSHAILHHNSEGAIYLLTQGASSRIFNLDGVAPIHIAAEMKSRTLTMSILTFSDDLQLPDYKGRTIYQIAKEQDDSNLIRYLDTVDTNARCAVQ